MHDEVVRFFGSLEARARCPEVSFHKNQNMKHNYQGRLYHVYLIEVRDRDKATVLSPTKHYLFQSYLLLYGIGITAILL